MTKLKVTDEELLTKRLKENSIKYKLSEGLFTIYSNELDVILNLVSDFKHLIKDFQTNNGTLNDVFLSITGKEIRA